MKKQSKTSRSCEAKQEAAEAVLTPELLQRARAHDRQALTALYEATNLDVYRTIHAMVRDEQLTLDIQQDTYLQAFSHLDQLREAGSFLPWVRQIAVNLARAELRRKRPALFTELDPDGENPEAELPEVHPEASPELALDRKETSRLVREILDGLTDAQRLILGMYYYENIPVKEIAEQTGLSAGTVKIHLSRGRERVEKEVRRLETEGVRLFGLSPMPFLLALLKRSEPAAGTGERALAGALPQAAQTTAVHVGRSFFQTALGRVVLGGLAAVTVCGGVLGYGWVRDKLSTKEEPLPVAVETDEDLRSETLEDLPTEPVVLLVTETEPTETEPTETEPTETEPSETEQTKTEPTETEPIEPARPSEPAAPPPSESSSEATAPSTETQSTDSETLRFSWAWDTGSAMDWEVFFEDGSYGESRILTAAVAAPIKPELVVERDGIVKVSECYYNLVYDKTDTEQFEGFFMREQWKITPLTDGVTRIYFVVDGEVVDTLTVTVQTPVKLLGANAYGSNVFGKYAELTLQNCTVGLDYTFYASVQGAGEAVFSTDNESVVRLGARSLSESNPPFRHYEIPCKIVGAGDAHVYLSVDGKPEKTWTIHAVSAVKNYTASGEDLLPFDAEPQVISWWINRPGLPVLLHQPDSQDLYVEMKGTEPPVITVDDPSVLSIEQGNSKYHEERDVTDFWFRLTPLRSGVCTVTCSFNGKQCFILTIVVP